MNNLFHTKKEPFWNVLKAEDRIDFKYNVLKKGIVSGKKATTYHLLFFLKKGKVDINYNRFFNLTLSEGECLLLPKSSQVVCEAMKTSEALIMVFDKLPDIYDKQTLGAMEEMKKKTPYTFEALPTCTLLDSFLDLMIVYLKNGLNDDDLFRIKVKEAFIIFDNNYTRKKIVSFFHPLIGISGFKNFVLENYLQAENVSELVNLCGMKRTAFDLKFREEFGLSARQWMLKQIANQIRFNAMEPDVSIKDLIRKYKFSSATHFNWFCRRQYGCTPGELLKKTVEELKDMKI